MADVFISYHMESAGEVVRQIAEALERDGVSCWYAGRDMEFGAFAGVIVEQIEACKVFLAVLNRDALCSAHVAAEFALAFQRYNEDDKQIRLVPFMIDQTKFNEINSPNCDSIGYCAALFSQIDGVPPDEAHIRALAEKIREALAAFDLK